MTANSPLSILQVGAWFPGWGGTELHLLNLSQQLTRRGHRVIIACRPEAFVAQEAARRGLRSVPISCENLLDFAPFGDFLTLLRSEPFDLVHVHWHEDHAVAPLAARLRGVPVVATHHFPRPIPQPLAALHGSDTFFRRIVTVSESVRRTLLQQGIAPNRVTTIHHGTDVAAFQKLTSAPAQVRAEWGIPPDAVLVGVAGQILPHKGVTDFLMALALMRETDAPPIYGVVIGDGGELPALRERAAALELGKRLVFAGFRADINNALAALDIFTLASVWPEPCAAVIQQAMALSKPVIGTRTGGTPELIAEGETGLLIPPRAPQEMAAAIAALAADPERRRRLGEAGHARVIERFTLSKMTDQIIALYQTVLAENKVENADGRAG